MKTKNYFLKDWKAEPSEDGKTATISGYASVFGNVDAYGEVVRKGAFAKSIAAKMPKMLWQHDNRQPMGKWTEAFEDDYGLFVRGLLPLDLYQARNAFTLISFDAIDGLSIGYRVIDEEYNRDTGVTTLKELDLLEISIVTFPANELATISDIKSLLEKGNLPTLKEFEKFLRDAGFSRSQAVAITNHGLKYLHGERVSQPDIKQFVSELQQFNALKLY